MAPLIVGTDDGSAYRALLSRASGYRGDLETENFVVNGNSTPEISDGIAFPLRADDGSGNRQVVVAGTLGAHHGNVRADQAWTGQLVANGLRASDGHHGHSSPRGDLAANPMTDRQMAVHDGAMGVRRLTPLECERLMGWPDGWTERTADGKKIPDSHRYRMCGNGVVSTVAEYIGHRLVAADSFMSDQ